MDSYSFNSESIRRCFYCWRVLKACVDRLHLSHSHRTGSFAHKQVRSRFVRFRLEFVVLASLILCLGKPSVNVCLHWFSAGLSLVSSYSEFGWCACLMRHPIRFDCAGVALRSAFVANSHGSQQLAFGPCQPRFYPGQWDYKLKFLQFQMVKTERLLNVWRRQNSAWKMNGSAASAGWCIAFLTIQIGSLKLFVIWIDQISISKDLIEF